MTNWDSGSSSERTSLEAAGWMEKNRKSFEIEGDLFECIPIKLQIPSVMKGEKKNQKR